MYHLKLCGTYSKEVFFWIHLTNQKQFSMVCTLINHRNDVNMFKPQVEPWAMGEWFYCKVVNILSSWQPFYWSMRVQTMENCCCLVFTITLTILMSISIEISWKTVNARKRKIASSPSHRFHGLFFTLIEHNCTPISAREIVQLL